MVNLRIINKFLETAKNRLITDINFDIEQFEYFYDNNQKFHDNADEAIYYKLADLIYQTAPKVRKDFIKDYNKNYNRAIAYLLNYITTNMKKKEE